MSLVNNRDEVVLKHYGKKGMKWGVRTERKSSGRKKGSSSGIKGMLKKKASWLNDPKNSNQIQMGAAVAGALLGAFGSVAMWKLSNTPTGSGPKAQQIAEINRLFTGRG